MMNNEKIIELLKKQHFSIEQVLEDLMDIELYTEEDEEIQTDEEDIDAEPNVAINDDKVEKEDISFDDLDDSFKDLDISLSDDDAEKDLEKDPEQIMDKDDQIEQQPDEDEEQDKDKFLYNIRQLIKIRDLINIAITKTNEKDFIYLSKYVNKVLSTVANIGDDIYDREDLPEINAKLEEFMKDIVDSAKNILAKYQKSDKEDKANIDFSFLDLKGGN